jgi:hypothetical protein
MAKSQSKQPKRSRQRKDGTPRIGNSYLPEYNSWRLMKDRCFNPLSASYAHYGGRGITVCKEWKHSFAQFRADMETRPGSEYTIDRIDSDGNYEPSNCRCATALEQAQNMRSTRLLTYNGKTMSLAAWARHIGICHSALQDRLKKYPVEIALGSPKTPGGWDHKLA